jgi:hypothetical protein
MPPPESSPEETVASSPLDPPPASPPPLLGGGGHAPLSGEKHVLVLVSQQHVEEPTQALPQSVSDWHMVAVPFMSFPPLPPELVPELAGGGAVFLGLPWVAFSKGLEFGVDELHAATSAKAPTYIVI